jgi:hypothetical protein
MDGVKKAVEGSDASAIQRALDALTAAQHKAAEALYRAQGSSQQPPDAGQQSGSSQQSQSQSSEHKQGDVIDAEVVDEGKQ